MAVLVGNHTKLIVQGITGREGLFHAKGCRDYGTNVVGGVTPGKGGTDIEGFPVFNTVKDAVAKTGANATMIFVPPVAAADAILEAADAGIGLIVAITEGVPVTCPGPCSTSRASRAGWSAPTAPASSPRGSARSASCPATSTSPATSAWCPARAR